MSKKKVNIIIVLLIFIISNLLILDTLSSNYNKQNFGQNNNELSNQKAIKTSSAVSSVAISSDGDYVVAGCNDGNISLFEKSSSTPLWSYKTDYYIYSVAISSDGKPKFFNPKAMSASTVSPTIWLSTS